MRSHDSAPGQERTTYGGRQARRLRSRRRLRVIGSMVSPLTAGEDPIITQSIKCFLLGARRCRRLVSGGNRRSPGAGC
jgi:hypothetical protein